MLGRCFRVLGLLCAGAAVVWAQGRGHVVKRGEGEKLFGGAVVIKGSPRTGSQGVEMLWNAMAPGQSTGIHVHHRSDEFLYVVKGKGLALAGGTEVTVESGDVVMVPRGEEHRLTSSETDPLEIVFLVDKPGLASDFREAHARFHNGKWPPNLEELNKITTPNGTTCRTLK
jgi:mannose-6-phosphate isomerase-like protein (cupin superfamily)